jgi:filamentous hemagglutinin family protein
MRHHNLLLQTTVLCGLMFAPGLALANPQGGVVAGGSATISSSGNTETIHQTSNRAIINWSSFDIGSGETTQFQQPGSGSIALNRISQNNPSQINGTLTANGTIILVNPNGVIFGAGSQVNVGSLVATTADTDNTAFMNGGKIIFNKPGNPNAKILAQGHITAAQAGLIGLVAPQLQNDGVITAKVGQVTLASGDGFVLDFAGDGITQVTASPAVMQQMVKNGGFIANDGGSITLTAATASGAVSAVVVNTGVIKADTFQQVGGQIILSATDGTVTNTGVLEAKGGTGQMGGNVSLIARDVQQQGTIDASGDTGGGHVDIAFGKSYTDTSSSVINASTNSGNGGTIDIHGTAGAGSTLTASGTYEATSQTGQGGSVSMFADNVNVNGAQVNVQGQNGGKITIGTDPVSGNISQSVTVSPSSTLTADGTQGQGGTITVDGQTVSLQGDLSAQGTTQGGNINVYFNGNYTDSSTAAFTVASSGGAGGNIDIEGGDNASLTASGTYVADGNTTGGMIDLLTGQDIMLLGAYLSSRGSFGGGAVRVGGDFHGQGALRRAKRTYVDGNTVIIVDDVVNGNGGSVVVWSDDDTEFYGNISAKGGSKGGNGGMVETSGHYLNAQGVVNASAPKGSAGEWLLDPADLTITNSTGANVTSSGVNPIIWQTNGGATSGADSFLDAATLDAELNAGTNVVVQTTNTGSGGTGAIIVNSAISATVGTAGATGSLTLSALSNIVVNAAITLGGAGVTGGDVTLQARNANGATGYVQVNAPISTNGGNIKIGGGSAAISAGNGFAVGDGTVGVGVDIEAALAAGGGNVIINGLGGSTAGNNYGVEINNTTVTTSGTGTVSISGNGGSAGNTNHGIFVSASSVTSTGSGNMSFSGVAGAGTGSDGVAMAGAAQHIGDDGSNTYTGSVNVNAVNGDINISGNFIKTHGGNVALSSTHNVITDAITTGGGNVLITARDTNRGIGYDLINGAITTGGGNITIGGSSFGIVPGLGYGIGDGTVGNGVDVEAALSAGGGNILINGEGGTTVGHNEGIKVRANITTSGTGTINLSGDGGTAGTNNDGINVLSSTISSTGSGAITLFTRHISGAGSFGLNLNTATIGGGGYSGQLTLIENSINVAGTSIATTGNIDIEPSTVVASVGVGSSANCGGSCAVTYSDALIGSLTYGSLKIGDNNFASSLDFNYSGTFNNPLGLFSGGSVTLDSAINSSAAGGSTAAVTIDAAGGFLINTSGAGANTIHLTGASSPVWYLYVTSTSGDVLNGLTPDTVTNGAYPSVAGANGNTLFCSTGNCITISSPPSGIVNPPAPIITQPIVNPDVPPLDTSSIVDTNALVESSQIDKVNSMAITPPHAFNAATIHNTKMLQSALPTDGSQSASLATTPQNQPAATIPIPPRPDAKAELPIRRLSIPEQGLYQAVKATLPVIESAKTMRQTIMAGFVTFSSMSLGYLLLFGRALYITSLLGLRVGWQRLDPAAVLESLERESSGRLDKREKRMEDMFGQ